MLSYAQVILGVLALGILVTCNTAATAAVVALLRAPKARKH